MNHISLKKKSRPRCYAKSSTVQDAFQPLPGLISYTGVIRSDIILLTVMHDSRLLILVDSCTKLVNPRFFNSLHNDRIDLKLQHRIHSKVVENEKSIRLIGLVYNQTNGYADNDRLLIITI